MISVLGWDGRALAPPAQARLAAANGNTSAYDNIGDALEFGVTEMVPTIRKPRWTPDHGLPSAARVAASRGASPNAIRDELLAGDLDAPKRR